MYYAIEALTYLFDMVIIIIYMNGIFHKENRRTAYPLYIACFLIMEVLIYVNQALCTGLPSKQFTIATSTVSLLTTFALTFLYRTRLSNRIFVSISFQILALLGESFFLFLVKIINPAVIELPLRQLSILMNLGSKIMLFLLILVVIFFWNRHIKYHDYKYNLLLFTTPVLSLVITLCIPVRSNYQSNNAYYMIIAYFAIALLNILNYCLLDNCFKMEQIKDENLSMRRQIDFQQEKYFQLGTAYKKTRSIVHDMKNHYFAISEMLKQQQTEQLDAYLHSAINDIEANYISVNSGNLVLDAFISSFEMLAKEKQRYLWMINLMGAALNVAGNFALIPALGASGAAIASVATQFFTNFILCLIFKPIKPTTRLIIRALNPKTIIEMIPRKENKNVK